MGKNWRNEQMSHPCRPEDPHTKNELRNYPIYVLNVI